MFVCFVLAVAVQTREWYDQAVKAYDERCAPVHKELKQLRRLLRQLVLQLVYIRE